MHVEEIDIGEIFFLYIWNEEAFKKGRVVYVTLFSVLIKQREFSSSVYGGCVNKHKFESLQWALALDERKHRG